jgi:hypothetical protein
MGSEVSQRMKKRIAILILVFISTFSIIFVIFYVIAADKNYEKRYRNFRVSFDARISSENQLGSLISSDGTAGEEVYIPVQTEVHVVEIWGDTIWVETPFIIEIEGELHEASAGRIPIENIDQSSYAKELYQSINKENEQRIDSKIRNYLIISVIVAVIAFLVFSLIFLLIEKKCTTGRKWKILFGYLLFNAILSISFMILCIQYAGRIK